MREDGGQTQQTPEQPVQSLQWEAVNSIPVSFMIISENGMRETEMTQSYCLTLTHLHHVMDYTQVLFLFLNPIYILCEYGNKLQTPKTNTRGK